MANPKENGTKKEVLMNVAGTILQPVAEALASGKFIEPDGGPVAEGEKEIGEFTDMEKALYTEFSRLFDECAAVVESGKEKPDNFKEKESLWKAYKELLNASCRRLGEVTWEGKGIGFREGYKIVALPKGEEDEMGRRLAVMMFGGM